MDSESLYWLFSAAAQSIAALIAFLLAGVALAFSIMDRVVEQDETVFEVIEALKNKQHKNLSALTVATGIAIIASLLSVYINPVVSHWRDSVMIFAGVMDMAVIVCAIYFVIAIVSPGRYARAAREEYSETKNEVPPVEGEEPVNIFFKEFVRLEQDVRAFLREKDLFVPGPSAVDIMYSFRQMVNVLYQNEVISEGLRKDLYKVNKLRNLLFHGHMDVVEEGVVATLRETSREWERQKQSQSDEP